MSTVRAASAEELVKCNCSPENAAKLVQLLSECFPEAAAAAAAAAGGEPPGTPTPKNRRSSFIKGKAGTYRDSVYVSEVVKEGWLQKKSSGGGNRWQKRYFQVRMVAVVTARVAR